MRQLISILLLFAAASMGHAQIVASDSCDSDTVDYSTNLTGIDSVKWDFGDPTTGVNDTSTEFFPSHLYSDTGLFIVRLIRFSLGIPDTLLDTLRIYPRQSISLPSDTAICNGDSIRLGVTQPYASYLWSNGSTSDSITIVDDTLVMVTVTGVCDTVSASVRVSYDDPISFDLGPDTSVCVIDSYQIVSGISQNAVIQWSTGQSTPNITIGQSGNFEMNAVNACGSLTDQVNITLRSFPTPVVLPNDTSTCATVPITVSVISEANVTYLWSTGHTGTSIQVDTTGQIWLQKVNSCDTASDTMNLAFNAVSVDFGRDTTICSRDSLVLDAFNPGASYVWSSGETTSFVIAHTENDMYSVTVTKGECSARDGISVNYSDVLCEDITCTLTTQNVFTPNGDGINDLWYAQSDCKIESFSLWIYNRWGQKVHTSDNIGYGWDGTINGQPAPAGTYYFELVFKDNVAIDIDRFDFRGHITLLRD